MAIRIEWGIAGAKPTLFVNGANMGFVWREEPNSFIAYDGEAGYIGKADNIQAAKRLVELNANNIGAELAEWEGTK